MNFEKSKVLLKKINALHQAADEVMGVSALEKDLMLQYVRNFYESITEETKTPKIETIKTAPPVVKAPAIEAPVPNIAAPEPVAPKSTPVIEAIPVSTPPITASITKELSALFSESEKEDSGSRYTAGSITDIGKSMGINDKILTINELFKGNQSLFNNTVDHLNGLSSFAEAKNYLASGVASDLNWSDANKKGKAIRFINMIRRRYSS